MLNYLFLCFFWMQSYCKYFIPNYMHTAILTRNKAFIWFQRYEWKNYDETLFLFLTWFGVGILEGFWGFVFVFLKHLLVKSWKECESGVLVTYYWFIKRLIDKVRPYLTCAVCLNYRWIYEKIKSGRLNIVEENIKVLNLPLLRNCCGNGVWI